MTIDLSPAVESRLRDVAERAGMTVEDYLATVAERADEVAAPHAEGWAQRAAELGLIERETERVTDQLESEYDNVPVPATPADAFDYWKRVDALGVFAGRGDAVEIARQLRGEEEALRPGTRLESDSWHGAGN